MSEPKRIQRKRSKGWRKPENCVSVTRPGKFGNPFEVNAYRTPARAVAEFERWLSNPIYCPPHLVFVREKLLDSLHELRGKDLMCFCNEGEPCHADVLLRLANE